MRHGTRGAAVKLILKVVALGGALGLAMFWWLTTPERVDMALFDGVQGDGVHGEQVFWAAGCASCHAAPKAEGDARLILSGGKGFPSDFGTFYAPNISSDAVRGIGGWSLEEFASAIMKGTGPEGQHYYPALPYATYVRATPADIADLYAFMQTLPASSAQNRPHDVAFPFSIRRLLGGWKFLFLRTDWVVAGDLSAEETRGRYLVEALGHCGECHTPRNAIGGLQTGRWLAGAPIPGSVRGRTPNITPAKLDWSKADIAEYLRSGFTPDFDTAGGEMASVVENFAHLTDADRLAVAAYLKRVPPVE